MGGDLHSVLPKAFAFQQESTGSDQDSLIGMTREKWDQRIRPDEYVARLLEPTAQNAPILRVQSQRMTLQDPLTKKLGVANLS